MNDSNLKNIYRTKKVRQYLEEKSIFRSSYPLTHSPHKYSDTALAVSLLWLLPVLKPLKLKFLKFTVKFDYPFLYWNLGWTIQYHQNRLRWEIFLYRDWPSFLLIINCCFFSIFVQGTQPSCLPPWRCTKKLYFSSFNN